MQASYVASKKLATLKRYLALYSHDVNSCQVTSGWFVVGGFTAESVLACVHTFTTW